MTDEEDASGSSDGDNDDGRDGGNGSKGDNAGGGIGGGDICSLSLSHDPASHCGSMRRRHGRPAHRPGGSADPSLSHADPIGASADAMGP